MRCFCGKLQKESETIPGANVWALLQANANAKCVEIEMIICSRQSIAGDINEIKQMLFNLAINGLEAMNGQGKLWIRVDDRDNWVAFSVKDTGPEGTTFEVAFPAIR